MVGRAGVEPKTASAETAMTCALSHQQRGAKSGALAHDTGPSGPKSAPSDLPPDVADLARRLAALPENVRAELLARLKTDERGTR